MTRSELFISENRRALKCSAEFWNIDSALMDRDRFETAKFRWLVVFPSEPALKGKSMTCDVINNWIKASCPEVFVDFCYLPCARDCKTFERAKMPLLVGNITHLDASHYDGIGFSIGLNHEALTAVCMLASCRYCDTPIPLTWTERKDLPLNRVPLIWIGGIAASVSDIGFGTVDARRTAFFDFMALGDVDGERDMFRHFIKARDAGYSVQQAIDTFWRDVLSHDYLYQPQAYRVTYNRAHRIVENIRINENAPIMCKPYHAERMDWYAEGSVRPVLAGNGSNVDEARAIMSVGCSAGGGCSFCHEGAYSGGYLEVPAGTSRNLLAREARRNTASNTFRPWGFNLNYLSHLRESLYDWAKLYSRVSFNNMRMEELGKDPEMFDIMKAQGVHHIMAPIDGISERLRNGLLNKGLSQKSIETFFRRAMQLHPQVCKVGIILTGYEGPADWQEFELLHEQVRQWIAESDGVLPIRYKATMLIHYPHTALYWLERKSARMSYEGTGASEMAQLGQQKVRLKTNGFRYSTFIEQVIMDLGRSLTSWMYDHFVRHSIIVRSYRDIRSNVRAFETLTSWMDLDAFFAAKDVDKTITPVHRIYLPSMPHIVQQARAYQAMMGNSGTWSGHVAQACISNNVCYSKDRDGGTVTIYGDVAVQPDGTLGGVPWSESSGCEVCQLSKARRYRIDKSQRGDRVTVGKFQTLAPRKAQLRLRFQLERNAVYEALNPRNTAYIFASALMKSDDRIESHFIKVAGFNNEWMSENGYQYPYKGNMLVDILFDSWEAYNILQQEHYVLPAGKSYEVKGLNVIYDDIPIRSSDYNIFSFSAEDMSTDLWKDCVSRYYGNVRVERYGLRSYELGDGVYKPVYNLYKGRISGYFIVPCKYSPWAYLHGIYHRHSRDEQRIYKAFDLQCLGTVRLAEEQFFGNKMEVVRNIANGYTCCLPFALGSQPTMAQIKTLLEGVHV